MFCRSISLKPIQGKGYSFSKVSQTFVGIFIFNFLVKMPVVVAQPIAANNESPSTIELTVENKFCLNSSNECVAELTEKAIASSFKLETLTARIALIEERLELAEDRIKYTRNKKWVNYISANPVDIIQNIFGGGAVQRDNIAIASLEIRTADLLAAKAELERQQEEEKVEIGDRILRLLLDYEAAERRHELLSNQLQTLEQQQKVAIVSYRNGRGSTNQMLGMSDRRDRTIEKIVEVEIKQDEAVRELGQLIKQ